MGMILITAGGLGWIMVFEPEWLKNHWYHWTIGLFLKG